MTESATEMRLVRAGIDTYRQPVVYMRDDCHVCRSEGFAAHTRVRIDSGDRHIIATLNVVRPGAWLAAGDAALSESAWAALAPLADAKVIFSHPEPPASASAIRAKVFGRALSQRQFSSVISDAMSRRLSDLELAAFVTACAGERLDLEETVALTRAMRDAGDQLDWGSRAVLDKHCVGGLPGNRTTPIVVPIVAAAGHLIPKSSSRAITSPAGTADTMEVMTPVTLGIDTMRRVVEAEGGCVVWGGALQLSPADDVLIRIERPLDFDSDGQMVASILSKKAAAGATHVLIDIPVGPTAKVRSGRSAAALSRRLRHVARTIGLDATVQLSDGTQPVGQGIGPALEARDVLAVLRRDRAAPRDLADRALVIAGGLLDQVGGRSQGDGLQLARSLLNSGKALGKFLAICAAQGGFREPKSAAQRLPVVAEASGRVTEVDNRRIAKIAKLAGAPDRKTAGVLLQCRLGDRIAKGDPLYEIHAETPGELDYARAYAAAQKDALKIEEIE